MENTNDYFAQKMNLLSELLSCSEEIMSSVNNDSWEDYERLGKKRQEVITKISAFEDAYRPLYNASLSESQRNSIDSKVKLILGFDEDIVIRLNEEKQNVLSEIKKSSQEKSIIEGYKKPEIPISGTFLDTKK